MWPQAEKSVFLKSIFGLHPSDPEAHGDPEMQFHEN